MSSTSSKSKQSPSKSSSSSKSKSSSTSTSNPDNTSASRSMSAPSTTSSTAPSSKPKAQSTTKRLTSELRDLQEESNPGFERIGPVSDADLFEWEAVMSGVRGTAYEGGRWLIHITIPPSYPLAPPTVTFKTPICHPNIHFKTGEVCLDLLKTSWSPAYTISSTLSSVRDLLDLSADPDSPLNVDVAKLARDGDVVAVEGLVRFFTRRDRFGG